MNIWVVQIQLMRSIDFTHASTIYHTGGIYDCFGFQLTRLQLMLIFQNAAFRIGLRVKVGAIIYFSIKSQPRSYRVNIVHGKLQVAQYKMSLHSFCSSIFQTAQELINNVQCVLKRVNENVLSMAVKTVEMLIYVYHTALGFITLGCKQFYMGGCMLTCVLIFIYRCRIVTQ